MKKKIGGKMAKFAYSIFLLLLTIVVAVNGRSMRYYSSNEMISDGVDEENREPSSFLLLKNAMNSSSSSSSSSFSSSEECEPLYGFLPCSTNIIGHLFLIVVYEYLLFHGESYVASGGEKIFKILGPGVFGASAFHVLGALPEALILLASGLFNTKEIAQEYVYTGVGLLAGTTILLLTVVWGTCVIAANQRFSTDPELVEDFNSSPNSFHSSLTAYGITTDPETSYTARFMVLSVIPYIIMQIPKIFNLSSMGNIFILIALVISVVLICMSFSYQIFQPWIQERRWEFVNNKDLILNFLQHVQKHALEKIFTHNGAPNEKAIKGLFDKIDGDGDNNISPSEIKQLLVEMNEVKRLHFNEDNTIQEVMRNFDTNGDNKINKDEFVQRIVKLVKETKLSMDDTSTYSKKSSENLDQVLQLWIENKRKERETKSKVLIVDILRQIQSNTIGNLLNEEDGTPNESNIKRLFEKIDHNQDNCISLPELKKVIQEIKFGKIPEDADETVAQIMDQLDTSGDHLISEDEFITGVVKWLKSNNQAPLISTTRDAAYQQAWEETDELLENENFEGAKSDKLIFAWSKAIILLVVGIVMLALLAEPLIESVQKFSKAASIPPFFISFILVPLATNARGAISAITEASRKKPRTTSLTFSEIYGAVLMNNILSFSVLLSIVYARGLTWGFSAELLVVLIVCATMGLATSFRSTFPVWTSIMAFLLYPLSLLLVYILDDVLNYS